MLIGVISYNVHAYAKTMEFKPKTVIGGVWREIKQHRTT